MYAFGTEGRFAQLDCQNRSWLIVREVGGMVKVSSGLHFVIVIRRFNTEVLQDNEAYVRETNGREI